MERRMMRQRWFAWLALAACVAVAAPLGGCISSSATSRYEGPSIGDRTLSQIEPGETTKAWVLGVLGEPTEQAVIESDEPARVEVWKWTRRKITTTKGRAVVTGSTSRTESVQTVYVEFRGDVVSRAWRD